MTAIQTNDPKPYSGQAATTSYYGLGGDASMIHHLHLQWDNALVATITFESSDFVEVDHTAAPVRPGDWLQENPNPSYISILGGTNANLTITVPGGTAGGASIHLAAWGARRLRAKVVATTPGNLRIAVAGKQ